MSQKRKDFETNNELIKKAYLNFIATTQKRPTMAQISKETGLNERTIKRHFQDIKFEPSTDPLRILTEEIIISIYQSAKKGNVAAQKLWLQIMEGWQEKTKFDVGIQSKIENKLSDLDSLSDCELNDRINDLEIELLSKSLTNATKPDEIERIKRKIEITKEMQELDSHDNF